MMDKLDSADLTILNELQKNVKVPIETLADVTDLSPASVQRRLKRLRRDKLILEEVALLNPEPLDQKMTFVVWVELERESLQSLDSFKRSVLLEPCVQQCYYVTGDADFVLVCLTPNMTAFEELTHRLFFENANVRRFKTNVVMGRTKVSLRVPIESEFGGAE